MSQNDKMFCLFLFQLNFSRVKKSGLNTTENQEAAEQSYGGDNQHPAPDNQYAPVGDQYAPVDDQFGTAEDQYTAGDNQYAPEDTEYSEEYQFTWGWARMDCGGFSQDTQQPAPL